MKSHKKAVGRTRRFGTSVQVFLREVRHHPGLKYAGLASALILVLLAGVWAWGNLYGAQYELGDQLISARASDEQLEKAMQQKADDYRLRIVRPDDTEKEFTLDELGMYVDMDATLSFAHEERNELGNRLQWWSPVHLELIIGADTKKLQNFIAKNATVPVKPAQNASLGIVDGAVQLTKSAPGKRFGLPDPMPNILEAASNLQASPLRMKTVAIPPAVTTQDLTDEKAKLEATLGQSITFTTAGQQIHPTRQDIASWLILEGHGKTVKIGVNTDQVQAYLNHIAASYSYPPKAQVTLFGGGVTPGSNGITVTNTHIAAATVTQDLLKGKGLSVELPATVTPFETVSAAAAGKWIEVDLTNKRLYAYEGANLLNTFLISAGEAATPTVTGTFAIQTKLTSQTMSGPNADGTNYIQPDVPWVNYFFQDYAIHGNYWRPTSYFGNVHSSHGCVGLLPNDAAWLYAWADVGTPVVVHY